MARKQLGTAPTNPEDAATKAYADTKFVPYASTTDLDAVTQTELGAVSPATNWGAYTGITAFDDYTGSALVETVAGIRLGTTELTQTLVIGRHSSNYVIRAQRFKPGVGGWGPWTQSIGVPAPVSNYDPATKSYVDGRSLSYINAWAGLDILGSTAIGRVYPGGDLGTLTGLSEFNGNPGESDLLFEHHNSYIDSDYFQSQVQLVWVPMPDQSLLTIQRSRTNAPSYSWSAWSAWAIVAPAAGVVETLVAGTGISIDDTDPANPIVSASELNRYSGVNNQTGTTYTPVLSDENKLVTLNNASAITVTLPQDSDLAIPISASIDFSVIGAGMATFTAGTGATVNATPSAITRAQYSTVTAIKRAANTWLVVGDLA